MQKLIPFIFFFLFSLNCINARDTFDFQRIDFHGNVGTRWASEVGGRDYHTFKSEANIGCNYALTNSWVSFKMKASSVNGKESAIFLDKAFLGYELFNGIKGSLTVEVGRNKMSQMFDSKLQFNSYFNGAHFVYQYDQSGICDLLIHGGPHVIDSYRKHYGCIIEGICSNIGQKPLTIKYSFIDWNAPRNPRGIKGLWEVDYYFTNSQVTVSYEIYKTLFYAAYILNHQRSRDNYAFYFGAKTGQAIEKGDVELDIHFRSAQEKAISYLDAKFFRRGVEIKAIYVFLRDLNIEAKFSFFDDYNGRNNNRYLEVGAVYSW